MANYQPSAPPPEDTAAATSQSLGLVNPDSRSDELTSNKRNEPIAATSHLGWVKPRTEELLLVTTSGHAAEYQGHAFGLFEEAGLHEGVKYYRQMDRNNKGFYIDTSTR